MCAFPSTSSPTDISIRMRSRLASFGIGTSHSFPLIGVHTSTRSFSSTHACDIGRGHSSDSLAIHHGTTRLLYRSQTRLGGNPALTISLPSSASCRSFRSSTSYLQSSSRTLLQSEVVYHNMRSRPYISPKSYLLSTQASRKSARDGLSKLNDVPSVVLSRSKRP